MTIAFGYLTGESGIRYQKLPHFSRKAREKWGTHAREMGAHGRL
jgi:hypothetical protein